jgi:membrane associated rhomboid family serine protease
MIPPVSPDSLAAIRSSAGRFKRAFRQLASSHASWLLLGILALIQGAAVIWNLINRPDGPDRLQQVQILLGLKKDEFLSGDFWKLFSYGIIHGNWLHLLMNGAVILLLGSKLEHIVSKRTYRWLCLYSIFAGGLMFLLMTPYGNAQTGSPVQQTLVGSSAICFAFLVLLTTLSPDSKFLPVFFSGKTIGIAILLASLLLALLNPELPTGPLARYGQYLSENGLSDLFKISHACHFGGALAGWLYGRYLLRPRVTLESLRRAREKAERAKE